MKIRKALTVIFMFLALVSVTGCQPQLNEIYEENTSLFAMDTYMTFKLYGNNEEVLKRTLNDTKELIVSYEKKWSVMDTSSEIYLLNHSSGIEVEVSNETIKLLQYAKEIAFDTNGSFDPTICPIVKEWGFTTDEYKIPQDEIIQELLTYVDYQNIKIDGNRVVIPSHYEIDLGAVVKGYVGDKIIELWEQNDVSYGILNLGGNVQTLNQNNQQDWKVGIRDPFSEKSVAVLQVNDKAVVTSGSYERYFVGVDGNTYSHIIDPKTGIPVNNGLLSVTIISEEGRKCDALSTSLYVMGIDEAINYWENRKDFDFVFLTEDKRMIVSENIKNQFEIQDDSWKLEVINQ